MRDSIVEWHSRCIKERDHTSKTPSYLGTPPVTVIEGEVCVKECVLSTLSFSD